MTTTYIAFDLETSSSDPNKGEILSLGAVNFHTGEEKYFEFQHQGLWVVPKAMEVNRIDITKLYCEGVSYDQADGELADWLKIQGLPVKALGLNVGSFDLIFTKERLPLTAKLFGYQVLDLNTMFEERAYLEDKSFDLVRRAVFEQTNAWVQTKKPELYQHHALYDCLTACCAFALLTEKKEEPEWMKS